MTIYKVLNEDRTPCHGGIGKWPPIGEWLEVEGPLIPCQNGIHLCDGEVQLLSWLGPAIWQAEYEGKRLHDSDKIVIRKARLVRRFDTWNLRTARLFACDCADRALARFSHPDLRSIDAVRIARLFAKGEASAEELAAAWNAVKAAKAAASYAARDAAWDAAWDTAWIAARLAARDAARAAAWEATRPAARAAAWDAEQQWQAERLKEILWNT